MIPIFATRWMDRIAVTAVNILLMAGLPAVVVGLFLRVL